MTLVNGDLELDRSFLWGYHDASWEDMVRSRTNDDGWADFPSLAFRGATVLVESPGFARQRVGWREEEKELKLELPAEAVLSGEVTVGGKPAEKLNVSLRSAAGDTVFAEARAEDKGRFRIGELPGGAWTVTIRSEDPTLAPHEGPLTLLPGDSKKITVELPKQPRQKSEL